MEPKAIYNWEVGGIKQRLVWDDRCVKVEVFLLEHNMWIPTGGIKMTHYTEIVETKDGGEIRIDRYAPQHARDDFNEYWGDTVEYPKPTESILPLDTLWTYIATTFLNGWINCVKPIKAFLITRYTQHEENIANAAKFNGRQDYHTEATDYIDDDVLLLAMDEHNEDIYWFFWSDRDSSDSRIGRFKTADPQEHVVKLFEKYCQERSRELSVDYGADKPYDAIELDAAKFTGWVSL